MGRTAIVPKYQWGPCAEPSEVGPEAASQSWKVGAPLIGVAGLLTIAGTNPRSILGIAADAASTVTGTERRFYPMSAITVWEGSLDNAGALGTTASAAANRYAEFGLTIDSGGIWYIDTAKTTGGTNTMVLIVGFSDPVGSTTADTPNPATNNSGNNRVLFVFLNEISTYVSA